jgi:uncharacterized membrane protein
MSSAHLHLILNHFPVIGTILIIMVVGYGVIRMNKEVIRTGLILTIIIAIISVFAYTTGEGAEDMVEGMDDVSEEYIEEHEDFALYALIGMEAMGVIAIFGLVAFRNAENFSKWFITLFILLLLVNAGMMGWTANLGGKIHHPEIHNDIF